MRAHLYHPVLKPTGGLATYATVDFIDSVTGLPTEVPLYLGMDDLNPIDNPAQFSPGVIDVWADSPTRLDLRITADGTIPLLLAGVDMLAAPEEMLVVSGGLVVDAMGDPAMVLKRTTGGGGWTDVVLIPAHQHDGSGANSTLVGEQALSTAFTMLGRTGTTRGVATVGATGTAKGGAIAIAFQVSKACSVNAARVWFAQDPGVHDFPSGTTWDGACFVGIASAVGATPSAITFLVKQSVEQVMVAGENICQFPTVALATGTTYYLVLQNPTTGAATHMADLEWLVGTGPATAATVSAPYQGDSDATASSLFGAAYTGSFGDASTKVVTVKTQTVSGSHSRLVTRVDCLAHISKGSRRYGYYYVGAASLAAAFPDGTTVSTTFTVPIPNGIPALSNGEAVTIDYYEFNCWYNRTTSPNEGKADADGFIPDQLVTRAQPGPASAGGTGACLRLKYALGSGMDGLVIPTGANVEPTGQTASGSATAWAATTDHPAFDLGIMGTPVDAAADGTWVGYKDFTAVTETDTTVLGHGVRANADKQTLIGSNTTGVTDTAAKLPTQAVVIGTGSMGYQNSVTVGIGFQWQVETSPFVDLDYLGAYFDHLIVSQSMYADTNHGSYTVVTLGNGTTVTPPATTSVVLLRGDSVALGTKFTASKDVVLAGAAGHLGFHGSAGAVKPATFAHQSNVALQNLLVALQGLGLVVSS